MAPGVVVTGFPLVRRSNSTIEIGENTHLRSHVSEAPQISKGNIAIVADGGQGIAIGRHCAINRGTSLVSKSGIHIGDGVIVAPNVVIIDYDGHSVDPRKRMYHDKEIWRTGFYDAESPMRSIRIGNNVWIGLGATILKGVEVGENSVIGAGAVVRTDVPSNVLVAGNPAVIVRHI